MMSFSDDFYKEWEAQRREEEAFEAGRRAGRHKCPLCHHSPCQCYEEPDYSQALVELAFKAMRFWVPRMEWETFLNHVPEELRQAVRDELEDADRKGRMTAMPPATFTEGEEEE